jgi:hypothetical protein
MAIIITAKGSKARMPALERIEPGWNPRATSPAYAGGIPSSSVWLRFIGTTEERPLAMTGTHREARASS